MDTGMPGVPAESNSRNYFRYGQKEISHLKRVCPKLSDTIDKKGILVREVVPDLFTAIISSVTAQQISGKAAETIWRRFSELVGEITPERILAVNPEDIRKCGISGRKTEYITGIAKAAAEGEISFDALRTMEDSEVIAKLSSLRGVGVWTAEMLLIFSLQRPDVLSWGDLAIKKGIMKLYGLESLSKEEFEEYRKLFSPYNSVASLYLWEI